MMVMLMQEEMVMMMPFKYNLTLDIIRDIACGMKKPCTRSVE
jgi:hypothetical protein